MRPDNFTFEQAASAPVAAFTALQSLGDKGRIQPGQKVLIKGAAGGVGPFAVQIAKSLGAEVTGVCSTRNVDIVRSIGADQVIDYTQEDFANVVNVTIYSSTALGTIRCQLAGASYRDGASGGPSS